MTQLTAARLNFTHYRLPISSAVGGRIRNMCQLTKPNFS